MTTEDNIWFLKYAKPFSIPTLLLSSCFSEQNSFPPWTICNTSGPARRPMKSFLALSSIPLRGTSLAGDSLSFQDDAHIRIRA